MTEEAKTALIPLAERSVAFYDDEIIAFLVRIGDRQEVYIPLRPICDYLGLSWSGQRQRLMRDEVLAESVRFVRITHTNPLGGDPEMLCIPLDYLPGWLFGISATRVREELQGKITRYRRECFRVLWRAFQAELGQMTPADVQAPLAQVRSLALAIAEMADHQLAFEQRVSTHDDRLDQAARVVGELRRRVATLEDHVSPASFITEQQAAQISAQVKGLAELLTRQGQSKTSYQTVFAALYQHFGVASYRLIRIEQFTAVLAFLEDWRIAATTGGSGPDLPHREG